MLHLKARFAILLLACILWLTVLPVAGKNEDKVIIGKPEIGKLFAAQYRYYQSRSAGSVSVQNNTNENLRAETSITVAGYTPKPFIIPASLPAGKTTQVPLRIDFNPDKLPTEGEPLVLDAEVEVSVYSENEQLFQKRLTSKFQLHNLHRFPDIPPEAMAVFIDVSDQSVAEFAQEVSASISANPALRDNSKKAQKLFELMKQERIICVEGVVEEVQYPRELLRTKIGSGYDCALLYAALLENSNVPVALTVFDDYILVLFQQQEQQIEEQQQKEVVSWKDKYWIPLDIRMLKATFSEAKATGMRVYENLKQEGKIKPFILRETWEQYKPVKFILPESVKDMELGLTYVYRGNLGKAEQVFKNHVNSDASAAAYNNLGNISFRRGNFQEAEKRYLKALKDDPGDGAIYLNLGIAYAVADEDKKANAMFDRAFRELGSYAQMCYALGIKLDSLEYEELRSRLREAEKRALQSRTRPLGIRAMPDSKPLPLYWKRR
ncbi:tetratricopeptide repeat protein [bacterium]|nr:tetratricopeptide repeat protein [bacterium]